MLRINTNVSAMDTHQKMMGLEMNISSSLAKLSSGLRINKASDDATGLSIAESMRSQVNGLGIAQNNVQQGINLLNVADGALSNDSDMLQRMRDLAVQASNGTLTASDRAAADAEFQSLNTEISNIASNTTFNGTNLLNAVTTVTIQSGANNAQTTTLSLTGATTLILGTPANITTQAAAQAAIATMDTAIGNLDALRSTVGAETNQLTFALNNLGTSHVNMAASESNIRDVDVASEMTTLTKNQILMQAATAMLSQGNAQSQGLLSLFK